MNDPEHARDHQPDRADEQDRFALYDAAYVLGTLSPADRAVFVEHLQQCQACSVGVAELTGMPDLLARVPVDIAEGSDPEEVPLPASTLARLLHSVNRRRRQRRLTAIGMSMALAASLVLAAALLWHPIARSSLPGGLPSAGSRPAPPANTGSVMTLRPVQPSSIAATAQLTSVAWGTSIGLRCRYDQEAQPPYGAGTYSLVVLDTSGHRGQAASWLGVPGRALTINAATAVSSADIAALEVRNADGVTVLRAIP